MAGLIMTPGIDITREEYKELLQKSVQLEAVKAYLRTEQYANKRELMLILNMKEEEKDGIQEA